LAYNSILKFDYYSKSCTAWNKTTEIITSYFFVMIARIQKAAIIFDNSCNVKFKDLRMQ